MAGQRGECFANFDWLRTGNPKKGLGQVKKSGL
jgi:hypothetical protein